MVLPRRLLVQKQISAFRRLEFVVALEEMKKPQAPLLAGRRQERSAWGGMGRGVTTASAPQWEVMLCYVVFFFPQG